MNTPAPLKEFSQKYKIHEEAQAFVDILTSGKAKPFHACTTNEGKALALAMAEMFSGTVDFDGDVQEMVVPSMQIQEGIPISIYKPRQLRGSPPILVYFHGGGCVVFSSKSYETTLKTIARDAGCIVVNVEYRLWPDDAKGEAPFDDAVTATKFVLKYKVAVGGKPGSRVGVGGDSAGGQLAASVANDLLNLDFQILIYPNVDTSLQHPSVKEFANLPVLSHQDVEWFYSYLRDQVPNHLTNPRVNPIISTKVARSTSTLVLLAQLDPVRDVGLAYAKKLQDAGGKVETVIIEGVPHIFFHLPGHYKTKCQEAYGHVVKFIKKFQ